MRVAVFVVVLAAFVLAASASGRPRDRYCSPTGDYCTSALKKSRRSN